MASSFRHVVVLIRKNRSFCHVLGYIQDVNHSTKGLDGNRDQLGPSEGQPSA
jgi:phospholipase C